MNTTHKLLVLPAIVFSAIFLSAQSKPNLTGTWELNVAKSDMNGSPVTELLVQVEHKDPVLKYTATGNAGGRGLYRVRDNQHRR